MNVEWYIETGTRASARAAPLAHPGHSEQFFCFGHVSAVMKFFVDGLEVLFPYDYIYKEQHEYMIELKVRVAGLSLVRGGCE